MDKITLLEEELVELAGPLGKFVVKKQLEELGMKRDDISDPLFLELMKRCVATAIFDPERQKTALKDLENKLK